MWNLRDWVSIESESLFQLGFFLFLERCLSFPEISTSETDVSSHIGQTSKLGEDLLRMFLEEISPDVVVEVGGRRMKAHKCILSSRCQYFAAMLSGGWVESAGNVISLQG